MDWNDSFPILEDKSTRRIHIGRTVDPHKFQRLRDLIRSGPKNGPGLSKKRKQDEVAACDEGQSRLQEARCRVSSEDTSHLEVIDEARAKLERCVVLSMSCTAKDECSGIPDAMPMLKCSATIVSMNEGTEAKTTRAHGPHLRKRIRVCGAQAHRCKKLR